MTIKACLKRARASMAEDEISEFGVGPQCLYTAIEQAAETGDEAAAAIEAVERVAVPASYAFRTQVERFAASQSTADGARAVELSREPGAEVALWEWLRLPERRKGHVLRVLVSAILRARM